MADITLDQVKKLREKTQVGIMDCRKALIEANGDMDKAIEILRQKGAKVAAKRAAHETKHGQVATFISPDHRAGSLVVINTETDFSANTQDVKNFATEIAKHIVDNSDKLTEKLENQIDELYNQLLEGKEITIKDYLNDLISKIAENIKVGNFVVYKTTENGFVDSYIHFGATLGSIVLLEADKKIEGDNVKKIQTLAHDICMQIAVTRPEYIAIDDIPKDEEISKDKYEEVVLLEQPFIKNEKLKIKDYIAETEKTTGLKITIKEFKRFAVGKHA